MHRPKQCRAPAPAGAAPDRAEAPSYRLHTYLQLGDRLGAPARADGTLPADSPGHLAAADEASPCPADADTYAPTAALADPDAHPHAGARRPAPTPAQPEVPVAADPGRTLATVVEQPVVQPPVVQPPVVEPPTERKERPKRDKSRPSASSDDSGPIVPAGFAGAQPDEDAGSWDDDPSS